MCRHVDASGEVNEPGLFIRSLTAQKGLPCSFPWAPDKPPEPAVITVPSALSIRGRGTVFFFLSN